MKFKPSNYIHTLKDEFDEFYFNSEELEVLKGRNLQVIYQIFQNEKSKPDPEALC